MTLHRSDAVDPDPTFTVLGVNSGVYDPEDPGHKADSDMHIGGLPDPSHSWIPVIHSRQ
ncbi:hypothetical protein EDB86DRAFT_3073691 [Lactarius hatsudake]|nr:hypothetical protein EDB86DRAFT_3073691 [Lactarius hatsudake]